jgi:hypothetical protein
MRKRTIRNGMRLVLAALALIILASFYHGGLADLLLLGEAGEYRLYRAIMFWAAALGGYGVVLAAFGFILPATRSEHQVRLAPIFLWVTGAILLFFYLLSATLEAPPRDRVRPGETITI